MQKTAHTASVLSSAIPARRILIRTVLPEYSLGTQTKGPDISPIFFRHLKYLNSTNQTITWNMSGTIEQRYGATVYVSDRGFVCIKQPGTPEYPDATFIFHPEEVEELILLLQRARQEAMDHVPPDGVDPIDADFKN